MIIVSNSSQIQALKSALPLWCQQFEFACILQSNNIPSAGNHQTYELIAGVGNQDTKTHDTIPDKNNKLSWKLGFVTYETNHELHGLKPRSIDHQGFQGTFFFEPQILLTIKWESNEIELTGANAKIIDEIIAYQSTAINQGIVNLAACDTKEHYLREVDAIKQQIEAGTFYELNYCMKFKQEGITIDPALTFNKLNKLSPTPFSAFFKQKHQYLICASPERFLKKTGAHIIAQPIKGTAPRMKDFEADFIQRERLRNSEKEIAENIMIVDLMRNDLAKCAETGSVNVDELFEVYSFATVHQMISTVSATLKPGIDNAEIFMHTFPMGSMTGAPKREVMHYINRLEATPRGIFSGTTGYISPENDFDFNVVIRSIIYDGSQKELSLFVGSAITYDADAISEYEECLLKAQTMFNALDTGVIFT